MVQEFKHAHEFEPTESARRILVRKAASEHRFKELSVIHRASRRLQHSLDPAKLAQEVIAVLEETLGYDYASVLLINDSTKELAPFALSQKGYGQERKQRDQYSVTSCRLRVGIGITGVVAATGCSFRSGDVRQEPVYLSNRAGIRSELCVPMRAGGVLLGVINMESKKLKAYQEMDQRILEVIASQIAVAVQNSRLHREALHSQRMDAIGQLAGSIAHDFNNLLTVINGHCELLEDGLESLDQASRSSIEEVSKAGRRAADLTGKLLAFGRKQILKPKVVNLNKLLRGMANFLQRLVGEDIELATGFERDLGSIRADPGQLEQVVMNLVLNAHQAMPEGGKLCIRTANVAEHVVRHISPSRSGAWVVLTISDTGKGMNEETKLKLFEPFYTTREEGTGLGLSTVYGIVEQSGGHVSFSSQVDQGTTFEVCLPRVREKCTQYDSVRTIDVDTSPSETILLVEDNEPVRRFLSKLLERTGYRVLAAANGPEALNIADSYSGKIHLTISDVVMPLMKGPELARRLAVTRPDAKVLFLSGHTQDTVIRNGAMDSESHILEKPVRAAVLQEKVRAILDAPQLD